MVMFHRFLYVYQRVNIFHEIEMQRLSAEHDQKKINKLHCSWCEVRMKVSDSWIQRVTSATSGQVDWLGSWGLAPPETHPSASFNVQVYHDSSSPISQPICYIVLIHVYIAELKPIKVQTIPRASPNTSSHRSSKHHQTIQTSSPHAQIFHPPIVPQGRLPLLLFPLPVDGIAPPPVALRHQRGQFVGRIARADEDQDLATALVHRRPG